MRARALVLLFALAACSRKPAAAIDDAPSAAPPPPPAAASSSVASSAPDASTAPAPGPIVVRGYPHPIRNGMNDPASHVGFTKDGRLFGYCATGGGRDPGVTRCELVDAAGKVTTMDSESGGAFDPKKKKAIDAFLKDNAIPEIPLTADPEAMKPRPLSGTWAFTDITLEVARPEAPEGKPAVVRVGGSVGSEPPVYPLTLSSKRSPEAPPHFAAMNGMAISPDGRDLGMVATFFACEFCDSFALERVPLARLASSIYNDTGFRFHQKGDYARSAALFEKAAEADPTAKLPPYNLACALARRGDARAKDALAKAIERDPSAKARAKKDEDFASVRSEPWFAELVR